MNDICYNPRCYNPRRYNLSWHNPRCYKLPSADELDEICQEFAGLGTNRWLGASTISNEWSNDASDRKETVLFDFDTKENQAGSEISALEQLKSMTGLDGVKAEIERQLMYNTIMKMREAVGLRSPRRLMHMLLTGNPGTGKTTVARLIGRIYAEAGLLSSSKFVEASRASLVGAWIGETEKFTTEKIAEARGGILFIDEIYSLTDGSERDFGRKAIDTLMPVLSDPQSDIMVIGAGYPDQVRRFLSANPGLASRFPTVIDFPDYGVDSLMEIASNLLARYDFHLSDGAAVRLRNLFSEACRHRDAGNARLVVTTIENKVIPNLCSRLYESGVRSGKTGDDPDSLNRIESVDIPTWDMLMPLKADPKKRLGFR